MNKTEEGGVWLNNIKFYDRRSAYSYLTKTMIRLTFCYDGIVKA